MKREELISSKGYWIAQFQIKLFETVKNYLKDNDLNQTKFAEKIGVNKSYISQILNGDFDHKISKYVELMVACNKAPIINTIDLEDYIVDDACQFKHVLYTSVGKEVLVSNEKVDRINKTEPIFEISYLNRHINSRKEESVYY